MPTCNKQKISWPSREHTEKKRPNVYIYMLIVKQENMSKQNHAPRQWGSWNSFSLQNKLKNEISLAVSNDRITGKHVKTKSRTASVVFLKQFFITKQTQEQTIFSGQCWSWNRKTCQNKPKHHVSDVRKIGNHSNTNTRTTLSRQQSDFYMFQVK